MRTRAILLLALSLVPGFLLVAVDTLAVRRLDEWLTDGQIHSVGSASARPEAVFFAVALSVLGSGMVAVVRGTPRAALWSGVACGPYLVSLALFAVSGPSYYDGLPFYGVIHWYLFLLAAAAPIVALALAPAAPAARAARPRPVAAALIAHSLWVGPVITGLGLVGIQQAHDIAHEAAAVANEDIVGNASVGDSFLYVAATGLWFYAGIFAFFTVALGVLAWAAGRRGATKWVQLGGGLMVVPYLVLLIAVSTLTPFVTGDSDENVHRVIAEGPEWYIHAVRTICAVAAGALIGGLTLLVRKPSVR